jgi:hypothetical protein
MKKNDFKLAFTDNTTFTGIDAEGFYAKALLTGKSKEAFRLIPNVKSKIKLGELAIGNILGDADCSFSSAGEGVLNQKAFEVNAIKINLEYCQRTFEVNYLSQLLRPGSNNDEVMPATVESFLLEQVALKVSADTEQLVWKGSATASTYPLSLCDGLEKQLLADSTVIDVTSTTLSKSNIIAQLGLVYDAIPETIIGAEDLVIFLSPSAFRFYREALAAASAEANFMQNYAELHFLDVKLSVAPGISTNKMLAARTSNILLLTDLMSDFEDIQILPQKSVTGVPVVRMIGEFKFGVGYIFGSECVFYN